MHSQFFISIISLFSLFLIYSCNQPANIEQQKQELIDTDKAMSELAVKKGFYKAIIFYSDNDIIKLSDGQFPVITKKTLMEKFGDQTGPKTLTWEPLNVEVAKSGELGYTWGNWIFTKPETTYYGNYFTIWKKQDDGRWKVALDGGNSTPPPFSK